MVIFFTDLGISKYYSWFWVSNLLTRHPISLFLVSRTHHLAVGIKGPLVHKCTFFGVWQRSQTFWEFYVFFWLFFAFYIFLVIFCFLYFLGYFCFLYFWVIFLHYLQGKQIMTLWLLNFYADCLNSWLIYKFMFLL